MFLASSGIATDTRKINGREVFFALKGDNFNGNEYALNAVEKGCVCAIVDEAKFCIDERFILVEDVLSSLQNLAAHHRSKLAIPIVAITGTNGKTTTKELLVRVLTHTHIVHATHGNLNNHIGVPLTLLGMDEATEIAVIEMGANHIGEIAALCKIAQPNYGIITNIGKAHLEGFGSYEGVIQAKSELYTYILKQGGLLFVNSDNQLLLDLLKNGDKITYGSSSKADVKGRLTSVLPSLTVEIIEPNSNAFVVCETKIIGKHNFENIMAAIAVGYEFGISTNEIANAIGLYVSENNRSQLIQTKNNTIVLDAYNANPMNMKAAIDSFAKMEEGEKLVILGDMLELGEYAKEEHCLIIDLLKENQLSNIILIGDHFSAVKEHVVCNHFNDASEAAKWVKENSIKDTLVLLKGSRGIGLEVLVDVL